MIRETQAKCKLEAEEVLSREIAEFMHKREQQVKTECAAWATCRTAVTIARSLNNVPDAEKEEDSLAQLVATSLARDLMRAKGEGNIKKSPWYNCRDPSSPLHIESDSMKRSTFNNALRPKLAPALDRASSQWLAAVQGLQAENAARVEAEHAAWEAARAAGTSTAGFEPVQDGSAALLVPSPLPPIIDEEDEGKKAREFSIDDLPKVWWKQQINPSSR